MPLFATLTPAQRSQLCTALRPMHARAGTAIVRAGDVGDTFYVVEAGACSVVNDAHQARGPAPRRKPCHLRLPHGGPARPPRPRGFGSWVRCGVQRARAAVLAGGGRAPFARAHERVCHPRLGAAGARPPGRAPAQELTRLTPTMYFGELALLRGEARAATVLAAGDCDLLALERAEFMRVLGPLAAQLEQQASRYASVASAKQARGAGARAGLRHAGGERGPARLHRHSAHPWHLPKPVSVGRAGCYLACRSLQTWPWDACGMTTP